MSEGKKSEKVRKTESPQVEKKSEVGRPKSEVKPKVESKSEVRSPESEIENNSATPVGGPQYEIHNKSEIEHPTSEIKESLATDNSPTWKYTTTPK